MSSSSNKSSSSKPQLSVQTIVIAGITWAVLALLFFLLFSVSPPGEDRPLWYTIGTYVFEQFAFFGAAILCLRNWRSSQIVSGRNVWLGIGLGMLSYFVGNLVLGYWELVLKQEPIVSPGDLFYVATYVFLAWGMILAVTSRRLNLEKRQWAIVAAIAVIGTLIAYLVSRPVASIAQPAPAPAAIQQTTPVASPTTAPRAPAVKAPTAQASPQPTAPAQSPGTATDPEAATVPAWAVSLEKQLDPLAPFLGSFYIVGDVVLLIIATILLLAFWGGRFSQSWRMIAAATFCLYIGDIWLKYADNRLPDYQSGGLLEVFWVFSGVLFGIGAALEYDLSTRSRRAGGRKRA